MIKNMLFPIVLIVVVILGGVSADFLRGRAVDTADEKTSHSPTKKTDAHDKKDDGHAAKKDKKKDKKKKKKKGGHSEDKNEHDSTITEITYMKFKRQFVVPVMKGGKIESLVLLNLNLELGAGAPDNPYTLEPKLRDSIMRELLTLSHSGVFSHDLTSADTYNKLSSALLVASERIITNGVENVLILDLARQDQ